jgi:hypothetical protein
MSYNPCKSYEDESLFSGTVSVMYERCITKKKEPPV